MSETLLNRCRRLLPSDEANELDGLMDDMSSTAPSSVKEKSSARIQILIAKAEAEARRQSNVALMSASLIRRLTLCKLSLCETFKTASDANGIWGECQKCGKRVGYIGLRGLREIGRQEEERARD